MSTTLNQAGHCTVSRQITDGGIAPNSAPSVAKHLSSNFTVDRALQRTLLSTCQAHDICKGPITGNTCTRSLPCCRNRRGNATGVPKVVCDDGVVGRRQRRCTRGQRPRQRNLGHDPSAPMSAMRIRRGHRNRRRLDAISVRQPAPGTDQKRQNCARETRDNQDNTPRNDQHVENTRRCADSE